MCCSRRDRSSVVSRLSNAIGDLDVRELRWLLRLGFDPNEQDPADGWTLLHLTIDTEVDCATQNRLPLTVDMTKALLDAGADPHRLALNGRSPRDMALARGHVFAVELIDKNPP
jgi:ankyrin repeat protein